MSPSSPAEPVSATPGQPPTAQPTARRPTSQHTLQGPELSWLHLMLLGIIPAVYPLDAAANPALRIPGHELTHGDSVDLLDPEGVTLASVTVDDTTETRVAGKVEARSGFSIVDNLDLRVEPQEAASDWPSGPVWAHWVDDRTSARLREEVSRQALAAGASVAELVGVPTGQETSRVANAPVRVARSFTTRHDQDRLIVVPFPDALDDIASLRLKATIAQAVGASDMLVTAASTATDVALPLRLVEIDAERVAIPTQALDELVLRGVALPEWAAEPAVAAELAAVHRPSTHGGLTVLLSGLSGSGKSTVARALAVRLVEHESRSVSLLDGDVVRHHLSKGLGFSRPDRITNVLRIGFVASEITKAGGVAICCPIAPYDETRRQVRAMVEAQGEFVLVHVATPLEECERRDRKGLYAKARRGEIPEFTGISDPYEPPTDADAVIDTTGRTIDDCVDQVLETLMSRGVVSRPTA